MLDTPLHKLLEKPLPLIMGVLNTTPNSFSDGGLYIDRKQAVEHALLMLDQGADIIDIGGESTRPGAASVTADEELERVIPVIESLLKAKPDTFISIDTNKPTVMARAISAGARMVNDVKALTEPGAMEVVANTAVMVCLMHMRGNPDTMQKNPQYDSVVDEVKQYLSTRIHECTQAGIHRQNIIIDPGFGFGKALDHNLLLFNKLETFKTLDTPLLMGVSRKSMIGEILDLPVEQRLTGSLACAVIAAIKGADIIRVHDVIETRQVLDVSMAIINAGSA